MNKLISLIVLGLVLTVSANAQSAAEMARQQQTLENILKASLNSKPTKEAKKQAKEYKKEGWLVPAGEPTIEQQITKSQLLGAEYMADGNSAPIRRYLQHTAISTGGSYNAAYAAARNNAMSEISAMLETEIAMALQSKIDNAQSSELNATSVDKYDQRMKAIVHQSLANAIPVLALYRRLPNNSFEVQVRIAFDKGEIADRLKKELAKELEMEGDELNGLVDNALNGAISM